MKILSHLLLSATALFLISCSEKAEKVTTTDAPGASTAVAPVQAQPANTLNTANTGADAALNPPHGAPNHRCDIAVGAPLDSPPQPTLKPVQTPTFTPPAQGGSVAAGTNPPHGQPGHDCSIAVGAPLGK